jgi:HAD superfamily hydrolase (TIGR01490 family)
MPNDKQAIVPATIQGGPAQKRFAAFDIDGTLIRWQLYHAIADRLVKLNYVTPVTYESMRSARMDWKNRKQGASFKAYEEELVRVYQQVLQNLTPDQMDRAIDSVFEEYKDQVYTYTRKLVADLKKRGYLLFAISGSQIQIIQKIVNHYGFDDALGTTYIQEGERFTGESIHYLGRKDKAIKELVQKHGATLTGSIAVGDSTGDIAMLQMVEQPIAFNPEAELFKVAKEKGWKVVVERKNMSYELEVHDGKYQLV